MFEGTVTITASRDHVQYRPYLQMPLIELLTGSGLGSLLGMRHALEPDHLAAVTTLVSRERNSLRAALLGAWWGIGHTLALLVVGASLVLVRTELPPRVSDAFELAVAAMLIALGLRSIRLAAQQGPGGPRHLHRHGLIVHSHAAVPAHLHIGSWTFARRPLLIGAVHGLAGSGALTALVLATLPTTAARLMYVLLFGIGSTFSMAALSGVLGWPLARLGAHHRVARGISLVVGVMSIGIGIWWGAKLVA
jgi:high-affinity nickel-transport protein